MRLAVLLLSALGMRVCGSDAPPPPPMAAATISAQATLEPAHGGTIVGVEDRPVEVVVHQDGVVDAYMVGPEAPRHTVVVEVNSDEGLRPVTLTWNATTERHEGHLVGAVVVPGPIKVEMVYEGRRRIGQAPLVVVVAPRPPTVDVHVVAPRPRPHVDVHVEAQRPRRHDVDVRIDGRPRRHRGQVDVRVHAPRPPSVHVDLQVGGHGHIERRGRGMRRHGMNHMSRGHMKGHRRGHGMRGMRGRRH